VNKFFRLVLFVIVIFLSVFVISNITAFLKVWINAASSIPAGTSVSAGEILPFIYWTLPLTFYSGILFAANYALMNKIQPFLSFVLILVCSSAFFCAAVKGLDRIKNSGLPPLELPGRTLGSAGLMLSAGEATIILTGDPASDTKNRVISLPGEPLIFDAGGGGESIQTPSVSFVRETNRFFNGTHLDFTFCANEIMENSADGLRTLILAASLGAVLISISFIFNIGNWYLANLFLSAVLFRGVLFFQVFINSMPVRGFLSGIFRGVLPESLVTPLVFACLAILLVFYVIVAALAGTKGRKNA